MLFLYGYLICIFVLTKYISFSSSGSPNITYYTNGIVVFEGKKVTLICNATNDGDAIDPVQISWYNGTKLLKSDGNHITIYNKHDTTTDQIHSLLILDSINHTDNGEYICRAFNNPLCYTENKLILTVECEFLYVSHVSSYILVRYFLINC